MRRGGEGEAGGITAGILTISDRCYKKERADQSGPALQKSVEALGWKTALLAVVPDEADIIEAVLAGWADGKKFDLVLITGGTGLGPRDVTPEATKKVLDKELPGLTELMRREGSKTTALASLSRAVAGSRKKTLIINLPGSPRGAVESFSAVAGLVIHARAMLRGQDHLESKNKEAGPIV